MSVTEDRNSRDTAKALSRKEAIRKAQGLADKRWSNSQIGAWMGLSESTVRGLLKAK